MSIRISTAFNVAASEKRPAFVGYFTAGFPSLEETVDVLLELEHGGVDIVELGIPFSDPVADGPTIQHAHQIALQQDTTIDKCLELVHKARKRGFKIPVLFMSYYNPIMQFGEKSLVSRCVDAGVDGFIVVDLPPEEAKSFRLLCSDSGLSYIPLITPSTSEERIQYLASIADSFIYVVSRSGVTGAQSTVNSQLPDLLECVQKYTALPLAVGFGVSSQEHFANVGAMADGVVIGSRFISVMQNAEPGQAAHAARIYAENVSGRTTGSTRRKQPLTRRIPIKANSVSVKQTLLPSRFGDFGGQYIPEALYVCMTELERVYLECRNDDLFWEEFRSFYPFMGRPTPIHSADRLTLAWGGASVYLKREDLCHTGSHKLNNAIGQILVAKRLDKTRIIAESGSGQHGVATAAICAKLGLQCVIYMGSRDMQLQKHNVLRMQILGAQVVPVTTGSCALKDAINEAMRDFVSNMETTYFVVGSAFGNHPLPTMVRDFQRVIGCETREQMLTLTGKLPDAVIACVGGGSNAIGMFHPFITDADVRLVGARAVGFSTVSHGQSETTAAVIGTPGVLHGARTLLLQDAHGQILEPDSISRGMNYPGIGPEHAWLHSTERAEYYPVTDTQALEGFHKLAQLEGIIPALESSHAVFLAKRVAQELGANKQIVICMSGSGDKDVDRIAQMPH